ncbi:MAG TPA: 5'/3'-nucleotidase SurE [Terriglobia bacterium]|nr:5'/3'-nucleotidase SurE [Terriglobia bacterium]
MPEILLTNDDGIQSAGIVALAEAVSAVGRVTVVAPDRERSASSASLTLHLPLRYEEVGPGRFSVEGTPTDCVIIGLHQILPSLPDLVISGINKGANLGHDVAYSGTVSAASEGANQGIPSFAISLAAREEFRFEEAAQFAAILAERIVKEGLPSGVILNVNVPGQEILGVRVTRQGHRNVRNIFVENMDPRGRRYFWLDQEMETETQRGSVDSDYMAVNSGFISITPLKLDRTDYGCARRIKAWSDILFNHDAAPH